MTTTTNGAALRERMARVGQAKAGQRREDTEAHLRLSPGERIEATLRLSHEVLALFPRAGSSWVDDAADVWTRVNARLRAPRPE